MVIKQKIFLEKWDDYEVSLHDDELRTQKFFFDFVLRIIVVIWTDFTMSDTRRVYTSISKFLSISEQETQAVIMDLQKILPKHNFLESKNLIKEEIIDLFVEICFNYVSESAHTYGEEISMIPQSLNFSEELSLHILAHTKSTNQR